MLNSLFEIGLNEVVKSVILYMYLFLVKSAIVVLLKSACIHLKFGFDCLLKITRGG